MNIVCEINFLCKMYIEVFTSSGNKSCQSNRRNLQ